MLLAAFIMGIAGSCHCVGMCSPLSMAVTHTSCGTILNRLAYHTGRITVYGLLGTITAAIGYALPMTRFQHALSIILGVLLVIMAIMGMTSLSIPFVTQALVRANIGLKKIFSQHIRKKGIGTIVLLGSMNGLLPCGLTFLALSVCMTLARPGDGFAYMFIFGMGTLPALLGVGSIMNFVKNKLNWNIRSVTTGLMMLAGILLIMRVFFVHTDITHQQEQSLIDIIICR